MKKVLFIVFTILFILLPIQSVAAQEDTGPPVKIVEKFDPYYFEYLKDGAWWQGILMDEEEYNKYTRLKIEYNLLKTNLLTLETYSNGLEEVIEDHKHLSQEMIKNVEEIKKLTTKTSWWDENKFAIGIIGGALVTGLIIAGASAL